jgi:DNA repair exonuclease SbcCD ATPase subunit
MASTDFFDDDLVKHRKTKTEVEPGSTEAPGRPVSDFNLTRMARQKENVEESMAHAAQELERLRQRQENLEKEKHVLEDLRRRQAEYERGKREMLEYLNQSLISLEKDELNAERLLEMVKNTRQKCRGWLADIDAISEENWAEDQFREELGKGLARIEDIRLEYNKALAKIEALSQEEKKMVAAHHPISFDDAHAARPAKGFVYWLKVGFAVSLPLMLTLVVLWLLYYMQSLGLL